MRKTDGAQLDHRSRCTGLEIAGRRGSARDGAIALPRSSRWRSTARLVVQREIDDLPLGRAAGTGDGLGLDLGLDLALGHDRDVIVVLELAQALAQRLLLLAAVAGGRSRTRCRTRSGRHSRRRGRARRRLDDAFRLELLCKGQRGSIRRDSAPRERYVQINVTQAGASSGSRIVTLRVVVVKAWGAPKLQGEQG